MKAWLRRWLGIEPGLALEFQLHCTNCEKRIRQLSDALARAELAQYTPPSQPEPQKRVIQTRSMKEFNAILDREFEEREANGAG